MLTQKILQDKYKENHPDRPAMDLYLDRMPSTKIKAFFKEMPWLQRWTGNSPHNIYVSAISPELLAYRRKVDEWKSGFLGSYHATFEIFILLDKTGDLVTLEAEEVHEERKYGFFGPKVQRTEKILKVNGYVEGDPEEFNLDNTLQMLGERAEAVRFFISSLRATFIVYKVPKKHSLLEWMTDEQTREENAVCETIKTIDAEGLAPRT